jgi:hypothetical protein
MDLSMLPSEILSEMDMKRVGKWKRKLLRRLHGTVVVQGIWRIRTDKELREVYKYLSIIADIERRD